MSLAHFRCRLRRCNEPWWLIWCDDNIILFWVYLCLQWSQQSKCDELFFAIQAERPHSKPAFSYVPYQVAIGLGLIVSLSIFHCYNNYYGSTVKIWFLSSIISLFIFAENKSLCESEWSCTLPRWCHHGAALLADRTWVLLKSVKSLITIPKLGPSQFRSRESSSFCSRESTP